MIRTLTTWLRSRRAERQHRAQRCRETAERHLHAATALARRAETTRADAERLPIGTTLRQRRLMEWRILAERAAAEMHRAGGDHESADACERDAERLQQMLDREIPTEAAHA